ncbi:hypothetical protein LIER_17692 [Lithospermum erythrorhizon]|uniref:Uncharacterized protein n=1 Tax=Lithospermum erythrorhizon TaxID=34254 RepID=A0AAV3QFD9_LITER
MTPIQQALTPISKSNKDIILGENFKEAITAENGALVLNCQIPMHDFQQLNSHTNKGVSSFFLETIKFLDFQNTSKVTNVTRSSNEVLVGTKGKSSRGGGGQSKKLQHPYYKGAHSPSKKAFFPNDGLENTSQNHPTTSVARQPSRSP